MKGKLDGAISVEQPCSPRSRCGEVIDGRRKLFNRVSCRGRLGAMGLTYFDDDVKAFFSPHTEGKSAIPHSAGGRASDEERVTLSFRDLRAVAGLAIVGANLTRHD